MKIDAELNGLVVKTLSDQSLISVFKFAGLFLPRFCFHNNLAVAGNCRACLLEVVSVEKPVAACVTDLERKFKVWSESPFALKARENVLEILLANHPLDCPICDQAGECDLQDQAKGFGNGFSRFFLEKRGVLDKKVGPIIKTIMTRCIHCTRCVRFTDLIDGPKIGILNRGRLSEIGLYNYQQKESKLLGNVIDLCPVGALTARSYAFKGRPWELKSLNSIDPTDALGSSIYVSLKGTNVLRLSPKPNKYINGNIISDRCRYANAELKLNRMNRIYTFCSTMKGYSAISWFRFLAKRKSKPYNTPTVFLVSPDLSLSTLAYLRHLSNFFCGQLQTQSVNGSARSENYYFYAFSGLGVLDADVQNCLLFSANLETESAILAFKLKLRYQQGLLMLFSLGSIFFSSIKVNFLSLSFNSIFYLVEAKLKTAADVLFSQTLPLILVGYSFMQASVSSFGSLMFLKKKINSLLILKLNKFANDESLLFLNVKPYFRGLLTGLTLHCFNLADHLSLRKDILSSADEIFWFGSRKPYTSEATVFNFLIPTLNFFEDFNLFVSFENRFQSAQKMFTSLIDNRPLKHILSSIYFFSVRTFNSFFSVYVEEKLHKSKLTNSEEVVFTPFLKSRLYVNMLSHK